MSVRRALCVMLPCTILNLDYSPVKGPEGNIEYLLHLTLGDDDAVSSEQVAQLVGRSHGDLDKKAEKTEA